MKIHSRHIKRGDFFRKLRGSYVYICYASNEGSIEGCHIGGVKTTVHDREVILCTRDEFTRNYSDREDSPELLLGLQKGYRSDRADADARIGEIDRIFKAKIAADFDVDRYSVEIGSWDCEASPIGFCAFRKPEDPFHLKCLYCGDPDERK